MSFDKDFDENQSFDMPDEEIESDSSYSDYEGMDQDQSEGIGATEQVADDGVEAVYYGILLGILALFAYVIYKIYGFLVPIDEKTIIPVTPPMTQQAPAPIAVPAPTVAPKPVVREITEEPKTITKTIVQSAGLSEEDRQKISRISTSVTKQQDMIVDLSKDNEYMQREYNKLQREVDLANRKLDMVMKKLEDMTRPKIVEKKPEPVVPVAPKPLYTLFIRAMVDGRAWLVDEKGATATVIVGHELKDYGKVEKLLVNQGIITTSSGRIIKFKKAK